MVDLTTFIDVPLDDFRSPMAISIGLFFLCPGADDV
jgi:hypothetical protein